MENISGQLKKPFDEQVAFFRNKLEDQVTTKTWTDIQKSEHDKAFMVAGAQCADLLSDFAAAVDKAISQGTGIEAFRKDFDAIVKERGWSYKGSRNWRTRTIYNTNLSTSYAAGRLAQIKAEGFSHMCYKHSNLSVNPRPAHVALDGTTLPVDDPFWNTHYPPNGWGCQCRTVGLNKPSDAQRYADEPKYKAPAIEIDSNTGEPKGISKGWGYKPGGTVTEVINAIVSKKTITWPYEVGKAYAADLPPPIRDEFAQSYRSLPSVADESRRFAQAILNKTPNSREYVSLGMVSSDKVKKIEEMVFEDDLKSLEATNAKRLKKAQKQGKEYKPLEYKKYEKIDVDGYDFTINKSSVGHVKNSHGNEKGAQKSVTPEDYKYLPEILNNPDSFKKGDFTESGRLPAVKVSKRIGGKNYILIFSINNNRKMLVLKTFYIQ